MYLTELDYLKQGIKRKNIPGVYCIENIQNKKKYIGSSLDVIGRMRDHKTSMEKGYSINKHLTNSLHKYGVESFCFYVVEETIENLFDREDYWMEYYHTRDGLFGYNKQDANVTNRQRIIFDKEDTDHIIDLYNEKINIFDISKEFDVGINIIYRTLKQHISLRQTCSHFVKQLSDEEIKNICTMYVDDRIGIKNIGFSTGYSPQLINRVLKENGIKIRTFIEAHSKQFILDRNKIISRYNNFESLAKIAKSMNCSSGIIRRILVDNNIEIRKTKYGY